MKVGNHLATNSRTPNPYGCSPTMTIQYPCNNGNISLLKSPPIIGLASTSYLPTTKEFDTELFSEQVLSPKNKEFAKEMAQ